MEPNINTEYFKRYPSHVSVSFQTDIGNDPDDALALIMHLKAMSQKESEGKSLKNVVTTLYRPEQKAEVAAKICQALNYSQIPIYTGYGSTPQTPSDFTASYPFWPVNFGIPGFTNAVSLGQGKGFADLPFDEKQVVRNGVNIGAAADVILGLAPHTDLANALDTCGNINRIIVMGGFFGKEENGKFEVSRPGYNTAVDLKASEKVLCQKKHPVLIFNSQHVAKWNFAWTQEEVLALLSSTDKSPLGVAMARDIGHYWSNKKPAPYGNLVMADVLTLYVGVLHPELIKSTCPVEFTFHAMTYKNPETGVEEPIHMLHPQAKTIFSVSKKEASNVHIVTELAIDPEELRKKVVAELATTLFFKSVESFEKAVSAQKKEPISPDQIGQLISKL